MLRIPAPAAEKWPAFRRIPNRSTLPVPAHGFSVAGNGEVPMKKLSLALAFALSLAALPAAAFEGCGGYAQTPATPVATTEEATTPVTVAVDQAQPTTTAQISTPTSTTN